jgi:hypothetical protein
MKWQVVAYRIPGASDHHKGFKTHYRNSFTEKDFENMTGMEHVGVGIGNFWDKFTGEVEGQG